MNRWATRVAQGVLALLLLAWTGGAAFVHFGQGRIIYLPTREVQKTPRDLGLQFEELRLAVPGADGSRETIAAWWIAPGALADAQAGKAVLFLHGNSRNMGATANLEKVATLAREGFAVLTIDYRGFGASDGERPSETRIYADADAALDEFKRRVPDARKRILHGHSLGGAVAIDLAARRPEFAAVFIEASFTSMLDMSTGNPLYRLLPIDTLLTERFESAAKLSRVSLPVLFMHGTADARVPAAMSLSLHAAARSPKALHIVEGALHNNLHTLPQYQQAYRALLAMAGL
ncbi:MAG: alpha/beta fold hydrolase [Burkholderiales bacterium]|nr:alpha/beta fold hydrolase [Burkholderiales bacterium]